MSYLIAAVLLIFIIGLVLFFRSSKKGKRLTTTEPAVAQPEESMVEHDDAPLIEVEEAVAEQETVEPEQEDAEPVAEELDYEPVEEPAVEEDKQTGSPVAEQDAVDTEPAAVEPDLETDDEPVSGEPGEIAALAVEEEEFVELSFDTEETVKEEDLTEEDEFVEIALDMEEDSAEPIVESDQAVAEEREDLDIAPALSGAVEESQIEDDDAMSELAEKLNFYFGEDEEEASSAEETLAEADQPAEELEAEEEEFVLEEAAAEIVEPEVPARLTLDSYAAVLRSLEKELHQALQDAISGKDAEERTILEYKLQNVCEKLASIEDNFNWQEQLIETVGQVLEDVQSESLRRELPGFDIDEATKQLQLGNFEQVESILAEASLQLDNESELASRVYYHCGQLAEERLDFTSAFEDYRNANAAESKHDEYLLAAGRIARIIGNEENAQGWLEQLVRKGLEKGEKTLVQSVAQYELALVCVGTGHKEKAGALFKRSLEIKEAVLGQEHPDLAPLLYDYARLFESNGMYEEAEVLYRKSLAVLEKRYGTSHPKLGSILNKLAGLYEELELEEKALPLYERALAIKEEVLGKEHHDVGTILNNIAELLRRQGKPERAEPLFRRSLEIAENELGKDHPNLAVVLNNLAELYSQLGKEEEATRFQERAFSLFGLPGMDGDFVEMEKDDVELDDDKNTTIAGE